MVYSAKHGEAATPETNLVVVIAAGAEVRRFLSAQLVSQPVRWIMEGEEFPLLTAAEEKPLNRGC